MNPCRICGTDLDQVALCDTDESVCIDCSDYADESEFSDDEDEDHD